MIKKGILVLAAATMVGCGDYEEAYRVYAAVPEKAAELCGDHGGVDSFLPDFLPSERNTDNTTLYDLRVKCNDGLYMHYLGTYAEFGIYDYK